MTVEILLDGRDIPDRKVLHDLLAEKFQLPDYYGRNLDALYDLLTAYPEPIRVTVVHTNQLRENLGRYANSFLQTLEDAARSNGRIALSVFSENI